MYYLLKLLYPVPRYVIEAREVGSDYCRDSTPHIEYGPFNTPAEAWDARE